MDAKNATKTMTCCLQEEPQELKELWKNTANQLLSEKGLTSMWYGLAK